MVLSHLFNVCQFVVIVKEEGEVLVGDVHSGVSTILLMLLLRVTTTRESILGDLKQIVKSDSSYFFCKLFITFCLISFMESVRKMDDVGSEALILDFGPWSAGKKVE